MTVSEIKSNFEEEYGKEMEEYTSQVAQELQQKVAMLKGLRDKLMQLETALEASMISKEGSSKTHRLSAAALALAEKLETSKSAASELAALKIAAGTEGVVTTAVSTIPEAVKVGVPTLSQLQARFGGATKNCRQAALNKTMRVVL
jgi:dGTP triphosphohydrolase